MNRKATGTWTNLGIGVTKVSGLHCIVGLGLLLALAVTRVGSLWQAYGGRWLFILLFSFSCAYCLTPVVQWLALRAKILDLPSSRKVHLTPTPLCGGLAVYVAFLGGLLADSIPSREMGTILLGGGVLLVMGLVDDIRGLPARLRLIVQLVTTAIVVGYGLRLTVLPAGFVGDVVNFALTLLWIVGITNAMNFLDGMDGLCTGQSVIIATFLWAISLQASQLSLGWLAVALIGSCAGFLPYNFRGSQPAVIFLGDGGSSFLGFALACMGVLVHRSESDVMTSLASPLSLFAVLIYDMVYITFSRIATGKVSTFKEWINCVDCDHIQHRVGALLRSKIKTLFFILSLTICLGVAALVIRKINQEDVLLVVLQVLLILIIVTILERAGNRFIK